MVAEYVYDAWGNHKIYAPNGQEITDATHIANLNPFRYRGYYYDTDMQLYYLNSRYYSPRSCRFVSADDIDVVTNNYLSTLNGLNLYPYCFNNPIMYVDPTGHFPVLAAILCGLAIVGMGLTIGGVASDNNTMTAIGLTMVAIPAMISGVGALFSGATYLSIIGGITASTGLFTGLFATAEYQEAFTGNNWMLDAGMSEEWYNGLMLTTAAIATAGTIASSVLTSIGNVAKPDQMINSISKNPNRWKQVKEVKEAATGRKYRGGTSYYRNYINKWTGAKSGSHIIIRNGKILHKLHYHLWIG